MTSDSKIKGLLTIVFLISFSGFAAERAGENNGLAPEVTTADAKPSFRDVPYFEEAFIDATPIDRKDDIPVGE